MLRLVNAALPYISLQINTLENVFIAPFSRVNGICNYYYNNYQSAIIFSNYIGMAFSRDDVAL